ncbi:MAG: transcription-repair coupling factor [Myxococcaceae bacterium]|nr:transcription-repair coupling factor [Myxococcaceae bacterium]
MEPDKLPQPLGELLRPPPDPGADPITRAVEILRASPTRVRAQNLKGGARGYVLSRLHRALKAPIVAVAQDEEEAEKLAHDLAFFLGGEGTPDQPNVVRIPGDEVLPYDEIAPDAVNVTERLGGLFHLAQHTRFPALVLSLRALQKRVIPPEVMQALSERIAVGEERERDGLARRLVEMGYASVPLVEDVGTFSVRGDIVDVFSPLYPKPVRLEFFGDTIESMRVFDPETQRTVDSVRALLLPPARELLFNDRTRPVAERSIRAAAERTEIPTSRVRERLEQLREGILSVGMEALLPGFYEGGLATVFDYLRAWAPEAVFYLDDPLTLERAAADTWADLQRGFDAANAAGELTEPPERHYLSPEDLGARLNEQRVLEGGGLALDVPGTDAPEALHFGYGTTHDLREAIVSHHGEEGALSPLVERLARWRDSGVAVAIACGSPGQADRLKRLLLDRNVVVQIHTEPLGDPAQLFDRSIAAHLFTQEISAGFVDPGGLAVLSDEEIFGARARRRVRARRIKGLSEAFSAGFADLKEGDLVVHTDFGICRYAGLTNMEVNRIPGDFLVLEFAGRDKVYLPVSRMRLVQKFTGGDPSKVALDRLGGTSWEARKKRVKENLLKMAAELLKVYAARKAHPGTAFSPPDRYFRQFEADFEFEETPDQAKAIEDVLADMQKPEPMDRLVCGDVGYGKTEVAMRAAFKAVLDRKQVAVLVPTTVLAQQHYLTFKKRFEGYPVTIEVVSSMRKPAQVRETLQRAREGKVDILIGTHKLLGGEVGFRDLGLLIVDEEQRFGVKQKEAIKRFRSQVDCLTLTATPIPRTLNMAMSGIRDMSIIATPPQDRRAIRTFVVKFDPATIREAVMREIQRGGQVFFVHNRVESIDAMERFLKETVPEVTIGVAHGQMREGLLEKVMTRFVEKKFQLLLCTSIIESGIDIPSANTMIVNRADQFGLAQLYQLRGRVGRSRERAYAYLLLPAERTVTKDAKRRLEVLQAFTELGAGFSIASHDLEIRGAGNLLGAEQSGAIEAIGFDLYTQLLEEAVAEMRGEPLQQQIDPEVMLPIPALIPDDYVPDVHQRLSFYKRFSMAANEDELQDLRAELVDRFGDAPDEVDNLNELMLLKLELRELRLRGLESGPGRVVISLGPEPRLDAARLAALVQRSNGVYRLTPDMKLIAKVPAHVRERDLIVEAKKVLRDLGGAAGRDD